MIGVVLWSDQEDRKAVFWCEDHGDLAYYDAPAGKDRPQTMLNAGDMVEFDLTFERRMRRAHNPRVIEQKVCHGLQDQLRNNAAKKNSQNEAVRKTGDIIQFHKKAANAPPVKRANMG